MKPTALKAPLTLRAMDYATARTTDLVAVIKSVASVNEDGRVIIVKNPVHRVFTARTALRPVPIVLAVSLIIYYISGCVIIYLLT